MEHVMKNEFKNFDWISEELTDKPIVSEDRQTSTQESKIPSMPNKYGRGKEKLLIFMWADILSFYPFLLPFFPFLWRPDSQ